MASEVEEMVMPQDFRAIHFPYCVQLKDGFISLVLNRNYKPLGYDKEKWVDYAEHRLSLKYKASTKLIDKLSCHTDRPKVKAKHLESGYVYLYSDHSTPTHNAKNMTAYLKKLALLAKLEHKEPQSRKGYTR